MRSLSLRLLAPWLLSLAASVAVALLLLQLSRQTSEAQAARACGLIGDRYAFYSAGWAGTAAVPSDMAFRASLTTAVSLALSRQDGVEGGIWQADTGPLAYAHPTYSGSGPKTDLPAVERGLIAAVNAQAVRDDQPAARSVTVRSGVPLVDGTRAKRLLIASDLTRGTGGFNFAQGLMALSVGVGAKFSNATAGYVVQWFGFTVGFLDLAAIACAGLAFFALLMPETGTGRTGQAAAAPVAA